MATITTLRLRRTTAQLDALAKVEREIRATDRYGDRKYLREFSEAYQSYHSVLSRSQLQQSLASADVLLVGDYHALASCQRFCARLVADRAARRQRSVVLGVEAVFAHDQHILEEWLRDEIDERELRDRIRYDRDWQYDWAPFYELLQSARAYGAPVYGLDCRPRGDIQKIAVRDKHAAQQISRIRACHQDAQIIVLFGESHLAPSHLPAELASFLPRERVLAVLQNLDGLYCKVAGERREPVEAVRIAQNAICVFNATPLEKYESYRLCLERWRSERAAPDDLAPVYYNLIDVLLRILGIDKYKAPRSAPAIIDCLPEVYARRSLESLRKLLVRKRLSLAEVHSTLETIREHDCAYVPRPNAIFALRLNMRRSAELVAQFVQRACEGLSGAPTPRLELPASERFYSKVLDEALVYLGSRLLYPSLAAVRQADYYGLYSHPREVVESFGLYSYRQYVEMIDFLLLHKDYELRREQYGWSPHLIESGLQHDGARFSYVTRELGLMLGTELYDAYVSNRIPKGSLKALYFRSRGAGDAAKVYFDLIQRIARPRRLMVA